MAKGYLKVGELAKRCGKTVRTIRYYEELGLLEPRQRTDGGFRLFTEDDIKRVEIISELQELGFPLEHIAEIIKVWNEEPRGVEAGSRLRLILLRAMEMAQKKVNTLRSLQTELNKTLKYLSECTVCGDKPGVHTCGCCEKGEHKILVQPKLMKAIIK